MIAGLCAKEQAGVGTLDLRGAGAAACSMAVYHRPIARRRHRLVDWFDRLAPGRTTRGEEAAELPATVCPSCGAILAADQKTVAGLRIRQGQAGHSAALYRLVGFAKARKWMLLLGFALMVGSTVASLVPTYLTGPLIETC